MLNFAICDDNGPFLNGFATTLNKLIIKNDFDAKVVFKSTKISDLLDYMKDNKVDVLFLDILLKSDMNGIDIAEKIRKYNKDIYFIFTTGHLEYAFLAFQVKAFDYLPKPISSERLESTLVRLFEDVNFSASNFLSLNSKTYINLNDIYYIKRDGMKLVFQTNSRTYEVYSSFNKISNKLPSNFVRCHKSYIVNISNISHIETNNNTLYFNNDIKCYIGPKYKNDFLKVINNKFIKDNANSSNEI